MDFPNIGQTIDSAFSTYLQTKAFQRQEEEKAKETQKQNTLQNLQLASQFGPGVTMEGLMANPNAMQNAGLAAQTPGPIPDQGQGGADHLTAALATWMRKRQASDALGVRKETAGISKDESSALKDRADAVLALSKANGSGKNGGLEPDKRAQIEGQIMDDYLKSPTFSNLAAAKSGLRDLASIQANKSGAADIAAIYSFVKTMDNNAVKEGEIQLAQSALPGLDRVKIIYDNLKNGNKLTPQMKRELLTVSHGMYKSKLKTADEFRKPFVSRAQQYGINPDIAVPGMAIPDEELKQMMGDESHAAAGGDIVLQGHQAQRLAELRAKHAQGGLGGPR